MGATDGTGDVDNRGADDPGFDNRGVDDPGSDAERLTSALTVWLDRLTFVDLDADQVTSTVIDAVAAWAAARGWRVYRRAASVLPLPPPLSRRQSVLDVACARPAGPPVVVEVDHTNRRRTVDKLLAEAAAGRVPVWVRWGTGRFTAPPPPVRMVTLVVSRGSGPSEQGHPRFSRRIGSDRPPPRHSTDAAGPAAPILLPLPSPTPPTPPTGPAEP